MSVSGPAWLQNLVVKARKSDFIARNKRWIPHSLRMMGWKMVHSRSVYTVLGSKVYVPPDARNQGVALDQYEPEVTAKIQQLVKEGMTVCDVGANIGIITLLASRLAGPKGRVISFEPVPANAEILRGNIQRNGYQNVTVVQKAVASKPGQAEIHLSDFSGCHSLLPEPGRGTGRSLTIETVRLDSLPELQKIDLLKIDVEGLEIEVLKSLGKIRPAQVILEYNSERCAAAGMNWAQFRQNLQDLGFTGIECLDDPNCDLNRLGDKPVSVNLLMRG
jgi:FkbM family methyltransferase